MNRAKRLLTFTALKLTRCITQVQEVKPSDLRNVIKQVADWQIEHFDYCYSGRKKQHNQLDFTNAALHVGIV